jgi:hypothetical protein
MSGGTDFNRDLFAAEHLMIEDEIASTDIRARRNFGARIKEFTVNQTQSCHGKNRDAITLAPFWRVSVSVNSEPENLLILPPLDDSILDKLLLLKIQKQAMPMPSFTPEERQLFWNRLVAELPAFLYDLTQWSIPDGLKCSRFGIKYFHHPQLVGALEESSPEFRLLALIDALFKDGVLPAEGFNDSAENLQRKLTISTHDFEAKRLLSWSGAAGTYLGRLAEKHPGRFTQKRTATERLWQIRPPELQSMGRV